jgi:hypothetical protein
LLRMTTLMHLEMPRRQCTSEKHLL